MNDMARLHEEPAPSVSEPAQSENLALISMIERAARDPNVDIDKMERLFEMKERMQADVARRAYDAAFAKMQPHLPEIDKRGKIIITDKNDRQKVIQSTPYALWDDTNRLIKPILAQFGFGLSFRIEQTDAKLTTTAVLSHDGGHRENTSFSASIDSTGSKNNVQGWGSSFSYGKRYTGTAILNITTRGEDDDGKAAGSQIITDEQADELHSLITATETPIDKVLDYCRVESLSDLPAKAFQRTRAFLMAKQAKMRKDSAQC